MNRGYDEGKGNQGELQSVQFGCAGVGMLETVPKKGMQDKIGGR